MGDERLVDADAPQRDDRHRGRRDDAVEADRARPEQRGGEQPLDQHERLRARQERGIERAAAGRARAERGGLAARPGHGARCYPRHGRPTGPLPLLLRSARRGRARPDRLRDPARAAPRWSPAPRGRSRRRPAPPGCRWRRSPTGRCGCAATARAALRGLAGLSYDAAGLARRVRPPVLVAWGARAVLAAPRCAGRCWPSTTTCRPGRRWPPRCAPRPGAPTAWSRPRTPSRAALGPGGATILHPGLDLAAWPVLPPADGPPHALGARRARAVEAGRPGARDRRADPRPAAHDRRRADAGRRPRLRGRRCTAAPRRRTSRAASTSPAQSKRAARSPARTCCCTAPTPSRSGWCCWRRWRAGGRSWPRPPPGRWRSSSDRRALYAPGDAAAGADAVRAVLADPGDAARAGRGVHGRGVGRPVRRRGGGGRVTPFTAVVVLHDSGPELAALLASLPRLARAAAARRRRHRLARRRPGAGAPPRRRADRAAGQPRLRRRQQRRGRPRPPRRDRPAQPRHRDGRRLRA